ncbi:MAG: O-methyltransferase [Cellvibrionaceae bacterium]
MKDVVIKHPKKYDNILNKTKDAGFNQLSDSKAGALLASLCASKPKGKFIELGTGTGLCTAWMLSGMCEHSSLVTVDNDKKLVFIAKKFLADDPRVDFIVGDGENFITNAEKNSIDLIFADTWPGKYNHLEEALALLKVGGVYLIDDMLPQENWPDNHDKKADALINYLESRPDFTITKMCWSTGIIICVKNS